MIDPRRVQLGLDTFGDVTRAPQGGVNTHAQVLRDVVEEAVLADEVGADTFGVGEHHRADYAISSPEMVLAAIAGRTHRILLSSAVTVLSSDDPVRVFERFSTLDAVSSGRAEIMVGRGSFKESFALFGLPLDQYEQLFNEKLDLFSQLVSRDAVTWSGETRPALSRQRVYPPTETALRTWVAVGGTRESVQRAARYGMPVIFSILGGDPLRFRPYVDLFSQMLQEYGNPGLAVGLHSSGHIAASDSQAREEYWPDYKLWHDRLGAERGWAPAEPAAFEQEIERGSLYVGSPDTVARKIARTLDGLQASRFQLTYSAGELPHETMMKSIELYGREVIPQVRERLADLQGQAQPLEGGIPAQPPSQSALQAAAGAGEAKR